MQPRKSPSRGISRRLALLGLGASGLAACTPAPAQQETGAPKGWHSGPDLPFAVQEIYPTLHAGRIHQAGGFIAEGGRITGPTDAHVSFAPETGLWSEEASLPAARHHPHLVSAFGSLLAIGGFEAQSPEAVWVMQATGWRLVEGGWVSLPTLPRPAAEAVTAVIEGRVHLTSGRCPAGEANAVWTDQIDSGEHFVLDAPGGAWSQAAPIPTARNSAAAAMIAANWHVVGGRTVSYGNTAVHEVYDAREDRWRGAAPMPQGQGGLAAASVDGKLYAFGGEYFSSEGGGVFAQGWVYDPGLDSWAPIADMPHPRHGLGAVAADKEIYVIGGALSFSGRNTSAIVDIYRP